MESDSSSRKQNIVIGYIFAAGIGMVLLQWALATYSQIDTIPFSQFERYPAYSWNQWDRRFLDVPQL